MLFAHDSQKPVLLVDDDCEVRDSMTRVLARAGYAVAAASDGADAMEQLDGGLTPCVILLDLMMPVKDGYAFRREQLAKPHLATIPTFAISASAPLLERAAQLGFTGIVKKPLQLQKLRELIDSCAPA